MKRAMALVLVLSSCATVPPTPAGIAPAGVALPAAHPGQGALLVDVVEGPTLVKAAHAECTTPCALSLPYGTHKLSLRHRDAHDFEHQDEASALVLPEPQVLRRTLRAVFIDKPIRARIAGYSVLAAPLLLVSAAIASAFADRGHGSPNIARGLAIGGGALFVLGLPLSIGTSHRSAGAQTQFPLPPYD